MGKTPLRADKNSMNTQSNENKSCSSTIKMSSSSSIKRTGSSRNKSTRQVPIVAATDKENISNETRSSSDISDDEQMDSEPVTHKVSRKVSAVYEYATKLSSQEYQCKLCSKVKIHYTS